MITAIASLWFIITKTTVAFMMMIMLESFITSILLLSTFKQLSHNRILSATPNKPSCIIRPYILHLANVVSVCLSKKVVTLSSPDSKSHLSDDWSVTFFALHLYYGLSSEATIRPHHHRSVSWRKWLRNLSGRLGNNYYGSMVSRSRHIP